jgi:hypothetical protein
MKHLEPSHCETLIVTVMGPLRRSITLLACTLGLFTLFSINACAPVAYQINLKALPSGKVVRQSHPGAKITVAVFNDIRQTDDRLLFGKVSATGGNVIPILPRYGRVPEAVTNSIRDFLSRAGYQLSGEKPVWNLSEKTINPGWGRLLIGGNIDTLEIMGEDSIPVKTYRTKVRLTLVLADPAEKKILYRSSVETSSSLKDITFSGERIEQELNTTWTDALMKSLNDPAMMKRIDAALSGTQTKQK